jgi:cytochrome d ubiquinol oxidase subunit I
VGIWFAIGLASPEGTSTLIHNFVFGWAIEWTFFMRGADHGGDGLLLHLGRVDDKTHLARRLCLRRVPSWMSLVIINGILTFMLTPGRTPG